MSIESQALALAHLLATMREELLRAYVGATERAPLYRIEQYEKPIGMLHCRLINTNNEEVVSWREGIECEQGSSMLCRVVFEVLP